jgi:hypothetical protein
MLSRLKFRHAAVDRSDAVGANHALRDVSSKSHDRWKLIPENRHGMKKLDGFLRSMLGKGRDNKAA